MWTQVIGAVALAAAAAFCARPLYAASDGGAKGPGDGEKFLAPVPASAEQWDAGRAALRASCGPSWATCPPRLRPRRPFSAPNSGGVTRWSDSPSTTAPARPSTATLWCPTRIPARPPALRPPPRRGAPAVLYNHWHAGQYALGKDEMIAAAPYKQ